MEWRYSFCLFLTSTLGGVKQRTTRSGRCNARVGNSGTRWTGGWVDPGCGLDMWEKTENSLQLPTHVNFLQGADKSLAWPGSQQGNVSVRMAWISFGALPCRGKKILTAGISMLLKSRASLTCFRACFLPGRAKDLSAPRYMRLW